MTKRAPGNAREFAAVIAIGLLENAYITYNRCRQSRYSWIRRLALTSKTQGLINHDRALVGCEVLMQRDLHVQG